MEGKHEPRQLARLARLLGLPEHAGKRYYRAATPLAARTRSVARCERRTGC
jgi:hypothetical protein